MKMRVSRVFSDLRLLILSLAVFLLVFFFFRLVDTPLYSLLGRDLVFKFIFAIFIFATISFSYLSIQKKDLSFLFALIFSFCWLGDTFIRFYLALAICILSLGSASISAPKRYRLFLILFSVALLGSLIRTYKIDLDFMLIKDAVLLGDLTDVFLRLGGLTSFVVWPTINALEFILLLLFALLLAKNFEAVEIANSLRRSIFLTLPISSLLLVSQKYFEVPLFELNRGEFWHIVERYPSSFSDPNSFGICAALFILFLISLPESMGRKSVNYLISVIYFVLALQSGSRSFFLILFLGGFVLYRHNFFRAQKFRLSILVSVLTVFVIIFIFKDYLPLSVTRLVDTLTPGKISESLNSRFVYFRIGLESVFTYPLLGLGYGRFFFMQNDLAQNIGINLGAWRDNANSFYLQLASEGGILALLLFITGLIFLLIPVSRTSSDFKIVQASRSILLVFLVSLLLGPHLNFIEVKFLFVILIAIILNVDEPFKSSKFHRFSYGLAFFFVIVQIFIPAYNSKERSYGLHLKEVGSNPCNYVRWTGSRGLINLKDINLLKGDDNSILLINRHPFKEIIFQYLDQDVKSISLSAGERKEVNVASDQKLLPFRIFSTWVPRDTLETEDTRIVGLQVCYNS